MDLESTYYGLEEAEAHIDHLFSLDYDTEEEREWEIPHCLESVMRELGKLSFNELRHARHFQSTTYFLPKIHEKATKLLSTYPSLPRELRSQLESIASISGELAEKVEKEGMLMPSPHLSRVPSRRG